MASKEKITGYDESYGFGLPQDIRRGNPLPLDHSSVQLSLEDAQDYATNDPTAYVGQIISVYEDDEVNAYIISNENGDLAEVGSGSGGVYITKEDYDALPLSEKEDVMFLVYNPDEDAGTVMYNGVIYGAGGFDSILQHYVTDDELLSHIENPIHISNTERIYWNSKAEGEEFSEHKNDEDIHVTAEERESWNNKADGNEGTNNLDVDEDGNLIFKEDLVCVQLDSESRIDEDIFCEQLFEELNWNNDEEEE